jgi:hypothetical protein
VDFVVKDARPWSENDDPVPGASGAAGMLPWLGMLTSLLEKPLQRTIKTSNSELQASSLHPLPAGV